MIHRVFPRLAIATLGCSVLSAFAHEGHGLEGASHWHATDTVGLLVAAGAVVVAFWLGGRGK